MKKPLSVMFILLSVATLFALGGQEGVSTDGSTSMSKVIGALAETYEQMTGVSVTFNATGSGAGIQAVLEKRCDIGLSSRSLKESEKEKGLKETILALDGIAIIVNPENNINNINIETLSRIYKGEITNWKELGGSDSEIVLIGREAGSGTRDGFESVTNTKDLCKYRQELTSTGDVITTVASNPNAIGYASLVSVKETVKTININNVSPTEESVKDGSYLIQRPFILVTRLNENLSKEAQEFFDFATSSQASQIIKIAGAVAVK